MTLHRREFIKKIGLGTAGMGLMAALPACVTRQPFGYGGLPRSTPEAQGVESAAILAFLDAAAQSKHEFHSVMMARHGHVIAEGWWTPYRAGANHMLYSLSKSFTSTAVGFAVTEGRLTVDDLVVSFFPDDMPTQKKLEPHLAGLKVKHLLTMSVGRAKDSMPVIAKSENWVQTFLAAPIEHEPGSVFLYDSGATYMLSAIVQKVTGEKVIDYLRPRLFEALEIHGMTWETSPQGINTGGWGLSVPTEALAKFGQFYLQNGVWNGQQILPARWVHEATTFKIQQPPITGKNAAELNRNSDWHQGYCYQFWRCRHNAFRGDGAYGQFMIVMPEEDAVVAITCQTPDMQGELNLVWDHLLAGIKGGPLPADRQACARLNARLESLALPMAYGLGDSPVAGAVAGKIFRLEANREGLQAAQFQFPSHDACVFILTDDKGRHEVRCGMGRWIDGICTVPGTPPKLTVGSLLPCKVTASAAWKEDTKLEMIWRYYETPHHDTVTCHFDGQDLTVEFIGSVPGQKETRPVLRGHCET